MLNMADANHQCQQNSLPADILPSVPNSVMAKIKDGKFINFDDLLPSFIAPSSNDDYSIQINELGRGTSLSSM